MEARFPEQADNTFRNMETAGNPWGFARGERAALAHDLDVPIMAEKKKADILYWVGCSGSYDDRAKKVSRAVAKILAAAGVDFAILGEEERCTCESARRLGNEYLYQTAAQEIVEVLKQYTFKRILVTCPHCYNTFANEYAAFGLDVPVVHHAQLIDELIAAGRLPLATPPLPPLKGGIHGTPPRPPLEGGKTAAGRVVYHDSCYLGRYNGIYDAPRRVIEAAGRTLAPAPREREKGFCCGAGGGRMWLEERIGTPINTLRATELIASGAESVAAACPFCMTMLTDAMKKEASPLAIKDISEIVEESLLAKNGD
jgi:Fe-S oxidoreductase